MVVLLVLMALPLQNTAATPTETGQKLGEIAKAVIDTALPGVTKGVEAVMNLIWPAGRENKAVKKADVSQDDIKKAVEAAQKQAASDARKKIGSVSAVASELRVVYSAAEPISRAMINLDTMRTLLDVMPAGDELKAKVKDEWDVASGKLAEIKLEDKDFDLVREHAIRSNLRELRNARTDLFKRVDQIMARKDLDVAKMKEATKNVADLLRSIQAIAVEEIHSLELEVNAVVAWANAPQSASTGPQPYRVSSKNSQMVAAALKSARAFNQANPLRP
jgi:hypothetical protein